MVVIKDQSFHPLIIIPLQKKQVDKIKLNGSDFWIMIQKWIYMYLYVLKENIYCTEKGEEMHSMKYLQW